MRIAQLETQSGKPTEIIPNRHEPIATPPSILYFPLTTAFSLIELLVVICIISVLISVLLPALQLAKESAKSAVCLSNLRQLYAANMNYANDNGDYMPPLFDMSPAGLDGQFGVFDWAYRLMPYLGYPGSAEQYVSDSRSHGINDIRWGWSYKNPSDTKTKSTYVWFCPATRGPCQSPGPGGVAYWQSGYVDYGVNPNLLSTPRRPTGTRFKRRSSPLAKR